MNTDEFVNSLPLFVSAILAALIGSGVIPANIVSISTLVVTFTSYLIFHNLRTEKRLTSLDSLSKEQLKILSCVKNKNHPIDLICDPKDPEEWLGFQEFISAFNAPWTLAYTSLYPAFKNFIKKENVKLRIILFEGVTPKQKQDCLERRRRIKLLINKLNEDKIDSKDKIIIHLVEKCEPPATTFFISRKECCTAIIYIYPFLHEEPLLSLKITDENAIGAMRHIFQDYWGPQKSKLVNFEEL